MTHLIVRESRTPFEPAAEPYTAGSTNHAEHHRGVWIRLRAG